MIKRFTVFTVMLFVTSSLLFSGGNREAGTKKGEKPNAVRSVSELVGAGATFPYPLYSKIFREYYLKTGVKVNYQAIGSGGGIRQLLSKTVDFGGTDAFISNSELVKAKGTILHVPTCLGAVTVTYNLSGSPTLNFTTEIIAGIFLGEIDKWNDVRIQKENRGVKLPKKRL